MDELDAEFERRHPGVTVDRVAQPFDSWEAAYRAAFTAREGPDVMVMQPGASGLLTFAAGLEVLNDRLSGNLKEHLTQWESVTRDLKPDGDYYGVPITTNGWVFYYNKKLFAKAGLPRDFQPGSWSELREAGERLKAAGIQPFTGGNKEGYENSWWFSAGFQSENDPELTKRLAEGKLPYTDEAVATAFAPNIEMQEAGLYPSDRFSAPLYESGFPRFAEGKGAMILGLMEAIGYWGEFVPALGEDNVGMFFPPGAHPVGTLGNVVLSVPKFAQNKDAALALIEFQASKPAMETWAEGSYLPNRDDVALPADFPMQARELFRATQRPGGVAAPLLAVPTSVIWSAIPREMNQVLQGRTSLESAQEAMQEAAETEGSGGD